MPLESGHVATEAPLDRADSDELLYQPVKPLTLAGVAMALTFPGAIPVSTPFPAPSPATKLVVCAMVAPPVDDGDEIEIRNQA